MDYFKNPEHEDDPGADIFFFDYGVVACWGMTKNQEWTVVRGIAAQVGWGEWSGGEGLKKRPGSETIPKCDGAPCLGTTAHCTIFPHLLSTPLSAPQVQIQPLLEKEMEVDEFEYNFSATEKPNVRNDTVTLHKRFARDHKVSE